MLQANKRGFSRLVPNYTAKGCEPHEHKQNTGSTDMSENTESGRVSIPLQRELEAWRPIKTAPRNKRILVWTGLRMYAAEWVQNFIDGDEAFSVADLENGDRALVKPTHWLNLPEPPSI